jgi:hypothetical protein
VREQRGEHAVFRAAQRRRAAGGIGQLARHDVELPARESIDARAARRDGHRRLHAPEDVADAGQQLAQVHGLHEVVVRAHLETDDAIHVVRAARQDDHRDVRGIPQAAAEFQAFLLAQQGVEHYQVDARPLERALQAGARAGRRHTKAVTLQVTGQRRARLAVLVDDQHVPVVGHRKHCHEAGKRFHRHYAYIFRRTFLNKR